MGAYRVTERQNGTILDVNVHITICDFQAINHLANVNVGNARVIVGVGVLAYPISGRGVAQLITQKLFDEALRGLEGIRGSGGGKPGEGGELRRVRKENSMGV